MHLLRLATHRAPRPPPVPSTAHNRPTLSGATRNSRQPWGHQIETSEPDPVFQFALQNQLALIRHFDTQIAAVEAELHRLTKKIAARDYALLQTIPGIGPHLGATILYEIGAIARFPSEKDFLSYCRLVKGTVASAGKIKGLRAAKLGNPYLRWAFGEAALIAKRDPLVIGPLAQRLEAKMNGNKFKANTVLAIKLARAVYHMLRTGTGFDPERLVATLTPKKSAPGGRESGSLTGRPKARAPKTPPPVIPGAPTTPPSCRGAGGTPVH